MAQTLRYVTGTSYAEDDVAEVYRDFYGTSFVLPVDEALECVSSGAGDARVIVGTGWAFVQGYLYQNSEDVLFTLTAQGGGLNRIDAIHLTRNAANNEIRLAKTEGVAAAAPDPPALTANDFLLWYIYVPNGFGAASTVSNTHIYDQRIFYHPSPIAHIYNIENHGVNPEFMAYSDPTTVPEYWDVFAAPTAYNGATAVASGAPRGRAFSVSLGAAGVLDWVCDPPGPYIDAPGSSVCTLKGYIKFNNTGAVDVQVLLDYDTAATVTVDQKRYYPQTAVTGFTFTIRFNIDYATYTAPRCLRIRFAGVSATTNIDINPMVLTRGYVPGPFRQKHEVLFFDRVLGDASWNSTAKATGVYAIDLSASFGPYIRRSTRAVLGRMRCQDTLSANIVAGDTGIALRNGYGGEVHRLNIQGTVNSKLREENLMAGLSCTTTYGFGIEAFATGVLTVTLYLTGIVT